MNRNSKIKKKPAVKPLEEMNVLDNFLFTELAGNPEFREQFGRIILSVFLQRKLGKITVHAQSVFQGDGPLQRGIRLDVEVPELEYEDGLTYLYFYTGGKKGGNEEIKSLLTYLQSSIIENAKDEATQSIHESVEKIKRSAEVRGKYMTVGEMMDYYKELGYEEGKEEGLEVGREEGRVEGRAEGHAKGYAAGLLTGLLNLLSDLGDIPDQVRQQADKLDADGIKQWSKQASRSDSMEEFLQKIQ